MPLFLVRFAIEYSGHSQEEFLSVWKEHSSVLMKESEAGSVKQLWKVVGERNVYMVVDKTAEELDELMFSLPLMKKLGDQVQVEVTPLIPYETFSSFMKSELTGEKEERDVLPVVHRDGDFFWLQFDIDYPGKSQRELFDIWSEEVRVALGAKAAGYIVDLWKSAGKRQVHILMCPASVDALDEGLLVVPLMKRLGASVQVTCKAVRPYKSFYENLCSMTK